MSAFVPNRDVSAALSAAREWISRCLIDGGAILSQRALWTGDGIAELRRQFTDSPDESKSGFFVKLEGQMRGASPEAVQLMAEMLWALMLFQSNIKPGTKRDNVRRIWAWSGESLAPSHPLLRDECLIGIAHTGMAFNQGRWRELNFLIELAGDLAARTRDEREAIFADVERFTGWIDSVPMDGDRQFRAILRYLAFPEFSERVASRQHRLRILEAFEGTPEAELRKLPKAELDRRLYALRQRLEREHGTTELDFYEPPLAGRWQDAEPTEDSVPDPDSTFEIGYQALKEKFLYHLPDFRTFVDAKGEYFMRERAYKAELIEQFRETVVPAVEDSDWQAAGDAAIAILSARLPSLRGQQNVVNWRQIEVLKKLGAEERERLGRELGLLFDEEQPVGARVEAFSEALKELTAGEKRIVAAMQRSLTAFYLTLWDPTSFSFVKTKNLRDAFRHVEPSFDWQRGGFFAAEAEQLVLLWKRLFRRLQEDGLKPQDLIDVQGFLWVPVAYGSGGVEEVTIYEVDEGDEAVERAVPVNGPTNRILFGPPGTGKTFHTIDRALALLDPSFLSANRNDRAALKQQFDALVEAGRIRFVTFHQSFSYEDFVEGLRADSEGEGGTLRYAVADGVFKQLCDDAARSLDQGRADEFVLIIDEINRGNVSRIFGELITLIEPSKRAGAPEALEVRLPYSKNRFSVPANVHLVGTMNTADRSLAGLDIALRRRFQFEEMPPLPRLLQGVRIEGVDLEKLLERMNQRIEVLLDRDHQLGHAYFMHLKDGDPLEALAAVFRNQIVPLLQEYFFEDWERIALVLNDSQKPDDHRFVLAQRQTVAQLFGPDSDVPQDGRRWRLQMEAFDRPESYRGIIKVDQG